MAIFSYPLVLSFDGLGTHLDTALAIIAVIGVAWRVWRWSVKVSNKVDSINSIDPDTLSTLAKNIDAVNELVSHELNHNSGSSIKDKSYDAARDADQARREASRAADAAETAARGVQEVSGQLQQFMINSYDENRAVWRAIDGLKKDRAS